MGCEPERMEQPLGTHEDSSGRVLMATSRPSLESRPRHLTHSALAEGGNDFVVREFGTGLDHP